MEHAALELINCMAKNVWAMEQTQFANLSNQIRKMNVAATIASIGSEEIDRRIEALDKPSGRTKGSVAVVNINGTIQQKPNLFMAIFGGTSTDVVGRHIEALAANSDIKAIVLNVDSPGGTVQGVAELADIINQARKQTHIVSVANSMSASAAYWLSSQADESVMTPSGLVGSIGVYTVHEDWSQAYEANGVKPTIVKYGKYKAEGNFYEPLSEEAIADMQARVDKYGEMFTKAVARGRGVTTSKVENQFGQGRVLMAKDALEAGMVDRIATLDKVISGFGNSNSSRMAAHRLSLLENS